MARPLDFVVACTDRIDVELTEVPSVTLERLGLPFGADHDVVAYIHILPSQFAKLFPHGWTWDSLGL